MNNCIRSTPNFGLQVWVSFSTNNGISSSYGDSFVEVFQTLSKNPQVVAVGANCCKSEHMLALTEIARQNLGDHQTLILYPDNRDGYDAQLAETTLSLKWLSLVKDWLKSGVVGVLGGCCMVKPSHISQIKCCIDEWESMN